MVIAAPPTHLHYGHADQKQPSQEHLVRNSCAQMVLAEDNLPSFEASGDLPVVAEHCTILS